MKTEKCICVIPRINNQISKKKALLYIMLIPIMFNKVTAKFNFTAL